MKTRPIAVLFLGVFILTACAKNTEPKVSGETIPDDAISFEYDETMLKGILTYPL